MQWTWKWKLEHSSMKTLSRHRPITDYFKYVIVEINCDWRKEGDTEISIDFALGRTRSRIGSSILLEYGHMRDHIGLRTPKICATEIHNLNPKQLLCLPIRLDCWMITCSSLSSIYIVFSSVRFATVYITTTRKGRPKYTHTHMQYTSTRRNLLRERRSPITLFNCRSICSLQGYFKIGSHSAYGGP